MGPDFSYYTDYEQSGIGFVDHDGTGVISEASLIAHNSSYDSFTGSTYWGGPTALLSSADISNPTTRGELPLRIIIRSKDSQADFQTWIFHELLLPDDPRVELAPRILTPSIHPKTGELYLPLDRITAGKKYRVLRSENLMDREELWELAEVMPLQHVIIPRSRLGLRSFYSVEKLEELVAEGDP